MSIISLSTPVSAITRVGKTTASYLKRLGIQTVMDLLFYYPFRWQDLSEISLINSLKAGEIGTVRVKIQLLTNRRSPVKRKILTEGLVADKTGSIKVIWFNQPFITKILAPGDEVYLSGKVDFDKYTLQFVNPIYEKVKEEQTHTARIVPLYSLSGHLTQKQLRFLIKSVLPAAKLVVDFLPQELIREFKLLDLAFALKQIHFPDHQAVLDQAVYRLKFDELFLFQLQIQLSKAESAKSQAWPIKFFEKETKNFVSNLPFQLTTDQRKTAWQIITNLEKNQPMNRLLEGEVGSGKTLVATLAMLNICLNNRQAVLMAPTEILASQHYKNIIALLKLFNFKIALLTRGYRLVDNQKESKSKILDKLKNGEIKILIGTHALIQEKVFFNQLSLAIIDEQHRFGVSQRKMLREHSGDHKVPHLLSMTATPIPRSLALALYGDLDLSIIRQMPKERKKIITKIVSPRQRLSAYQFIRQQVKTGRQVFVICPLIDPSDKLGVKAATEEYEKLKKEIFSDLEISLLHGKLKSQEKEKVMADFLAKKSDILVATAVVEVGVDVPNAAVMLIEGSERFGLAQLHQFRGRVGRSIYQSYCFLITENESEKIKARLSALVTAKDGFELAEFDLKFRGPGEIYGQMQSGWPEFKIAHLTDLEIINQTKKAAQQIISRGINNYPLLKDKVEDLVKIVHLE